MTTDVTPVIGTCRNPGCNYTAVLTADIIGVGPRALCQACHDSLSALGMEIRILPADVVVPLWRQRDLKRDLRGVA